MLHSPPAADIKDVILCHAEPVAIVRVESFNTLRWLVESLPNGTKLYSAWEPKGWWHKEVEDLRQQLAAALSALQEVSDDWDGEHFHNGGGSFMPAVNKALGRGEQ